MKKRNKQVPFHGESVKEKETCPGPHTPYPSSKPAATRLSDILHELWRLDPTKPGDLAVLGCRCTKIILLCGSLPSSGDITPMEGATVIKLVKELGAMANATHNSAAVAVITEWTWQLKELVKAELAKL